MKPIAIVGGGIAALGAAHVLRRADVPFLIIEATDQLGGRLTSIHGEGWVADPGCPFFHRGDSALLRLMREVRLETSIVALQDTVVRLAEDGTIDRRPEGFARHRVTLPRGMDHFFDAWLRMVNVLFGTPVGALRWDEGDRCFQMRDDHTGHAVRHPIKDRVIEASGVILAVPGTVAAAIARASRFCRPLEPYLDRIVYTPRFVGIYRVPRMDPGFCALRGTATSAFEWIGFEERKHPGRVAGPWSVMTAWSAKHLTTSTHTSQDSEALAALYRACRDVLPDLPEQPAEQRLMRWAHAHPAHGSILHIGEAGVPTDPPGLPFALAGDYTMGDEAEAAAESGMRAAHQVLARLRLKGHRAR